jgi:hypothetical protein
MATRRYSTAPGDQLEGSNVRVVEAVGAATATKSIELTYDLANVLDGNTKPLSKQDVIDGIDRIRDYIIQNQFPPA